MGWWYRWCCWELLLGSQGLVEKKRNKGRWDPGNAKQNAQGNMGEVEWEKRNNIWFRWMTGSNTWVENAVNRVRQPAMTLIYHLELQLRMSFPVTHPLFSWRFVHVGCWTALCRKVTPFEAVCGREYDGRIACFAEPILAFVGTEPRQKGSAKWMKALFLTKTTSNDMYVVGIGNRVRLTRAVKCIYKDWVPQLEMCQKFGVHSWMVEGALGGRLKPGIAKKPEPHMLNFEDVTGESVPDLDDQVSGDGMILDFDGNQIPYSLMHPSSLGIEGVSFWFWVLSSLSQPVVLLKFKLQSSHRGVLRIETVEMNQRPNALEFQGCLSTRLKCTMLMTHVWFPMV